MVRLRLTGFVSAVVGADPDIPGVAVMAAVTRFLSVATSRLDQVSPTGRTQVADRP
jgi:hypothetical protein